MNKLLMAKNLRLSIIIVHFNTWEFLMQCLQSIRRSTLEESDYEVLVVDNASAIDNAPLLKKQFPWVGLVQNTTNTGFAAANNRGIAQAIGDNILLLNPDTVVEPTTLAVMLEYIEAHPKTGAATCKLELANGRLDDACHRGFPTPWNALCYFSGVAGLFPQSTLLNGYHLGYRHLNEPHEIDSACGAFLLVRREAGETVQWLDEDYFWYGEDIDFCYRLKEKGWSIVFVPQVKTLHYKGVSSGIKSHSEEIATADEATKARALTARFDVMRIFYKKHYQEIYPRIVTAATLTGINLLEYLIKKKKGVNR